MIYVGINGYVDKIFVLKVWLFLLGLRNFMLIMKFNFGKEICEINVLSKENEDLLKVVIFEYIEEFLVIN